METRRGEVITRREIDAIDEEELPALVRRHAKLLGERFPRKRDQFYCPDILDEPHLLRKLYRLNRLEIKHMKYRENALHYEDYCKLRESVEWLPYSKPLFTAIKRTLFRLKISITFPAWR